MLPQGCACYLINLDRSPDRLAAMSERLADAGIAFERVAAVDGMALTEQQFLEQTRENRYYKPLRRGEVGCQLSHLEVMRRFVSSRRRYAVILEDDAILADGFPGLLREAIQLREGSTDRRLAWDVLKLAQGRRRLIDLGPLGRDHRLVEYGPSVPITTAAAIWTHAAAERWVRAYRGTARPIDCDLQHPWEHGLRILSMHPPPVSAGTESAMGTSDYATRNPWPKLRYEGHRLIRKWRYLGGTYGWRFMAPWLWRRELNYHPEMPK